MKKSETDVEFKIEETRLKSEEMLQYKKERPAQFSLLQQQQQSVCSVIEQIKQQQRSAQQEQQQLRLAFIRLT